MQEALNSPYGVGPSALPEQSPAPDTQFMQQMSQVRIPQAEGAPSLIPQNEAAPVAPPQDPDASLQKVDPFEAEFARIAAMPEEVSPADAPSVNKPSFEQMSAELGPVEATKRYVGDSLMRAKMSFATTDFEREGALKNMYGKENVRMKDGELEFRRKGDKAFRAVDPKQLEYIDDALDFARDAVEIGIEGMGRVGGAMIGGAGGATAGAGAGLAAGPGALIASPVGAISGGMGGAIAGQALGGAIAAGTALNVGDFIASSLMQIPRDPERNAVSETAVRTGLAATMTGAGAKYAQWRAAKEAKAAANLNSSDVLNTARELETMARNLQENGINLYQGKLVLSPGQQGGALLPESQVLDNYLSTEGPIRKFYHEQGKNFMYGWDQLRAGISNATGKNADELFNKVKESAKLSTELEGKMIEGFRDQALKVTKGEARELPSASAKLQDFMFGPDGLGYRLVKVTDDQTMLPRTVLKGPSVKELAKFFDGSTDRARGQFNHIMRSMEKSLRSGGGKMSLADVDMNYKQMRKFIDTNMNIKGNENIARSMIGIKNELRDDWTTVIGQELEAYGPSLQQNAAEGLTTGMQKIRPNAFQDYLTSMGKYSDMKKAQETLGNILAKNDLSASAFADQLFSPATGKDKLRQMKILINENTPELWDQLKDNYLENLTAKHLKVIPGASAEINKKMNWGGLIKDLEKADRAEILDQLFDGKNTYTKKQMTDFFTLASKIDGEVSATPNALSKLGTLTKVRQWVTALLPGTSSTAKVSNIATLLGSMGKDKAVAQWMSGEGLELVVKGLPKPKQHEARILLNEVTKQALKTEAGMSLTEDFRGQTPMRGEAQP